MLMSSMNCCISGVLSARRNWTYSRNSFSVISVCILIVFSDAAKIRQVSGTSCIHINGKEAVLYTIYGCVHTGRGHEPYRLYDREHNR